jgi:endogenous inhibitor of DNA gyrase (YacG/DUF329 family)
MTEPCAECGKISSTSPSDYFCSGSCQEQWHAKRSLGYPQTTELIGNR